jgi:hypothetical protein
MPITARYILVCDDFRREDNGKFILIGLYLPDMVVPQIPFGMPTLTFFMNLESDRPGNFGFRMQLQHVDSGAILAQAMGMIPVINPQLPIICPVKIGGVQFNSAGLYSFSVTIDGERDPIVATWNVILNVPGPGGVQPAPPLGPQRLGI